MPSKMSKGESEGLSKGYSVVTIIILFIWKTKCQKVKGKLQFRYLGKCMHVSNTAVCLWAAAVRHGPLHKHSSSSTTHTGLRTQTHITHWKMLKNTSCFSVSLPHTTFPGTLVQWLSDYLCFCYNYHNDTADSSDSWCSYPQPESLQADTLV